MKAKVWEFEGPGVLGLQNIGVLGYWGFSGLAVLKLQRSKVLPGSGPWASGYQGMSAQGTWIPWSDGLNPQAVKAFGHPCLGCQSRTALSASGIRHQGVRAFGSQGLSVSMTESLYGMMS